MYVNLGLYRYATTGRVYGNFECLDNVQSRRAMPYFLV